MSINPVSISWKSKSNNIYGSPIINYHMDRKVCYSQTYRVLLNENRKCHVANLTSSRTALNMSLLLVAA